MSDKRITFRLSEEGYNNLIQSMNKLNKNKPKPYTLSSLIIACLENSLKIKLKDKNENKTN